MREQDLFGGLSLATLSAQSVNFDELLQDDLVFKNAQIYYSLFEIPLAAAQAQLPPSVHPSIPGLLGITFWRISDGPLGPFEFAMIGVACRTGIKPRHLIHAAFASTPQAVEHLRRQYGFPCRLASVQLRESYDRILGSVAENGALILQVETLSLLPIVGANSFIKVSPAITAVADGEGVPELLQFEASYEFKRVLRGMPRTPVFDAVALNRPDLVPVFPVSGAHAVVDFTIHPPRYCLPTTQPLERAGVRKLNGRQGSAA